MKPCKNCAGSRLDSRGRCYYCGVQSKDSRCCYVVTDPRYVALDIYPGAVIPVFGPGDFVPLRLTHDP